MISTTSKITIITTLSFAVLVSGVLTPARAQSVTPKETRAERKANNEQQRIPTLIARGDSEITKRIASLNSAITRVQGIARLTDAQKSSIVATYNSVITNLTTLKTKIDADTDFAILKTDLMSIYGSYRVYALVMPQESILTASDRIQDVITNMNALVTKLQTRITEAQSKGKDVTALSTSLTDLQAKISNAQTQAQNAVSGVSGLIPDGGDKTKAASNNQAIQTARGEIKTASQDLKTARDDAQSIVTALKAMK